MLENEMPLVSVYTCVYNGEKTIHRVFDSMKRLNYPNIEHVIVNDGSNDNTEKLIIKYIDEVEFKVKYIKKENGGKHTALNVAWDAAEGFFMIQLDADDELLPDSISYLIKQYFNIPIDKRDLYWCVHGRCVTQKGDFVGVKYPEDINANDWKTAGKIAKACSGEKIGLQRRDYLRPFRFREVKGVSYIPESIVWDKINSKYGTWYTNEVVRVYYVFEGGNLTDKIRTRRQIGPFTYRYKHKIMNEEFYGKSLKNILYYSLSYFMCDKNYRKNNGCLQDINTHKFLLGLLCPFAFVGAFFFRLVKNIK